MKLYKDRVNRKEYKFSLVNRVLEQWNKLPEKRLMLIVLIHFKINWIHFLKQMKGINEYNSIPINLTM